MKIERVVVTGGQDFTDEARIEADLRALLPVGLRRVAQGGHNVDEQFGQAETPRRIRSADALAWLVTARLHLDGATYRVNRDVEISTDAAGDTQTVYRLPVPPDVDGGWPSAGPRRSKRMLLVEKPDLVLAYPDRKSKGTWHCIIEAMNQKYMVSIWAPWMRLIDIATKLRACGVLGRDYECFDDEPRFVVCKKAGAYDLCRAVAEILRGADTMRRQEQ